MNYLFNSPADTAPWWKNVVCYQVWPKSFVDSNGDGHGDIKGLISKLKYLRDFLLIDVIWLSPTYKSPMKDEGYDISDWQAINPNFGTMKDMENLIKEVHKWGMKIILDLVVTHTSDEHKWFKEAKSGTANSKSDWYIFQDGRPGNQIWNPVDQVYDLVEEPTNWQAAFGGSTWHYVPERDQYYLHLFSRNQPDLNWEKKEVREAIFDEAIGFWLQRGVDGFRIDTVNRISKHQDFPDAKVRIPGALQPGADFYMNGPRIHEFLKEMSKYIWNHPTVKRRNLWPMLVGELPGATAEQILEYVHPESKELGMIFDFDVINLGNHDSPEAFKPHQHKNLCDGDESFTLKQFKEGIEKVQLLCEKGGWGAVFLENHDQCRSIERYATPKPEYHAKAAKLLCLLQTTLTGTQFIYQGQEIGMRNMPSYWGSNEIRDQGALDYIDEQRSHYRQEGAARAITGTLKFGRDNGRTPFQWDGSANAGFSDCKEGETWIGVNDDKDEINFLDQWKDRNSVWHFWREMILSRKSDSGKEVYMHGTFTLLDRENPKTFTYLKTGNLHLYQRPRPGATDTFVYWPAEKSLICLNFSDEEQELHAPEEVVGTRELKLLVGNYIEEPQNERMPLRPWEGRLYMLREPWSPKQVL